MGPSIVIIFQYISNKMQRYTFYLYLETALHVLHGISTHHQEYTQLYLQHLALVRPLLLPAAGSSNGFTDTAVCAPDGGWRYHPKQVEHFPEINYVTLHLVAYIQGVTEGTDQTSGECSLGQTIPI